MSLFRYGEFEIELDFTDVDTLESIENAYEEMQEDVKNLPKTGRTSEIIKAQIAIYNKFFDSFMGDGASSKMFGSNSLELRIDASEKLADFRFKEDERFYGRVERYQVNKSGNRTQGRNGQKKKRRNRG